MNNSRLQDTHILLVDDDEFAHKVLSKILETLEVGGIQTVDNGQAALDWLALDGSQADLIICDIEMPELNGFEFVRRIRYGKVPRFKNVPILMLTGKDSEENIRSGRIHKISGFIVKPPTLEGIRDHIHQILDE